MNRITRYLLAASIVPVLLAQEGGGTLVGTITDTSHAPVPSASIAVTNQGTGLSRTAQTDNLGYYSLPALPIGGYSIVVSRQGFSTLRGTGVNIAVGSTTRVDLELQVAQVSQDITVQAQAAVLNTDSAEGGVLLNSTQVTNLPLNGRNFMQLVTLEPGVRGRDNSGRQSFTMNGAPPQQGINLLVDGTDATGIEAAEVGGIFTAPGQSTFTLGLDSIAEFVVHADSFSVRYGKTLGGVIEVVSKSGTNGVHGNVFHFFRNDVLNANTIQGNAAGLPRAPLRFNQFGGNVGAPLVRNKMFFWAGFEGARRRTGVTNTFSVLSDAGRARVTDPAISSFIQTYVPRASQPAGSNPNIALLVRNDVQPVREDIGMIRYDYQISSSSSFFARYNLYDSRGSTPGLAKPNSDQTITTRQQLGTLSLTHVFSPTTTGNFRTGINRLVNHQTTAGPDPGLNLGGIFSITGSFLFNNATAFTYAADITRVRGRHTLVTGTEYHTTEVNRSQRGGAVYAFLASANQLNNFFSNTPDQLSSASVIGGNSGSSGSFSGYFEDQIKVSRQFTITAGLRYDYYFRPTEKYGRIIGLVGEPFPISQIKFTKPGEQVIPRDWNGWGPRVAFTYSPTGKTVIRGGWGTFIGLNYPALTTAAAFTFVPPVVPKELFNPFYAQSSIVFSRQDRSDLVYPNVSFLTPEALLQRAPPPSPNFPRPDWKNTYAYQWSFRVEREILKGTRLAVGYVGTTSDNIVGENQYNLLRPLQGNTRENPLFSNISLRGSINDAHYHSLQATFNKQLSRGLQLNAYYTWSKSIDNIFGFSGLNDPGTTPQTGDLAMQRSRSAFDVAHELKVDYYYQLPLDGWTALPRALREGWAAGGITRINTGVPYTLVTGTNVGDGVHTQRPNLACANPLSGAGAGLFSQMLTTGCFQTPNVRDPVSGYFIGSLGRNVFSSPTSTNFDFSVSKNTRLTDRISHQLRVEFFNIMNKANFQAPVTQLNNPNFGRILAAGPGRSIQFAMKVIY